MPPATVSAQGVVITLDSDALTITGDGDGNPNAFKGLPFTASVTAGLAQLLIPGDLDLAAGETLVGVGSNAVSLVAGKDVNIAAGATVDFSANGTTPGPGGGAGGTGGTSGTGGAGAGGSGGGGGRQRWWRLPNMRGSRRRERRLRWPWIRRHPWLKRNRRHIWRSGAQLAR